MHRAFVIFALRILSIVVIATTGCAPHAPGERSVEKVTFRLPNPVPPGPQHPMEVGPLGVDNFGVISPELWRGAEPTTDGLKVLAHLGVKTIIDLREADESAEVPAGVRYVRMPVSAWRADQVDVHAVLREIARSPKPVFIHCHQGRDRTGLAVAAYRLSHGMSVNDACLELRNFGVNPWWDGPIERRIHQLMAAHSRSCDARANPPEFSKNTRFCRGAGLVELTMGSHAFIVLERRYPPCC